MGQVAVPNQLITGFLARFEKLDVEKELYFADIALIDETGVREVALLLGLFLGEDVPLVGVLSLNLARASEGEPLFCARVGFHFRHFVLSYGQPCCLGSLVVLALRAPA